ncbi:MAG: hypothetical protein FJ276_21035, partial [Planctomycetes bacterium]|nr:hypothetical protein [Planctomycetota bacterium]
MNVHRRLTFLLLAVLGPHMAVAADAPPAAAVAGAKAEAVPAAAEAAPAALAAPLRYRRVFVPQTEITNFVRGGYWPIRREQFNQLVDRIREQASSLLADGVWMESAEYTAVWADGQLTSGVARWRITHAASRAAALTLTPCTLALGAAVWRDGESEVPAIIGTDGTGELVVHVEKSGELIVPWTARGQTNAWGETSFDLVLAPSPVNRLSLDVDEGMAVVADCGVVTAMPADGSGDAVSRGMRRWAVELGGARRLRLTVSPSRAQQQRQLAASVQQESAYRLLPDGLEAVCGVTLSIDREPLESLTFEVDAELQVTGVQLDGRDAAWTMAEATAGRPRELRLQFDEPLTAGEFQVELTAIGPLTTEVPWRLPACRVKHVFWRQGTLGLTVPESVRLRQLVAHDARPVRVDRLPDGEEGELRRFQLFAAHGGVEVVLARRQPEITAALGTTVDVERGLMTARVAMDLRCAHGECFALEADVPAAWTIEGIDCESTGPIDDYETVAIDATHKRLRMPLAAALTPERPMHLVLTAHRSPSYTLLATHVRPLRLRNAAESSRLVAVNVDAGYRFNLEGDADLVRLDHANLAAADARRLRPRAGGIVFVDNQRAASLAIHVVREEPAYAATCFADVAWDGAAVAEQYRIVCRPESAPVDRVLIHLSQQRPDDMQWSLTGNRGGLSGVRKLTARQQQRAKLEAAGETWELTLGVASDEPFEIHGARRTTMAMPCSLALPTLPAADTQEGWLTVRSLDGSELSLRADAAKPILVEPTARGTYSTSRARYRFNPSGNAHVVMDVPREGAPRRPLWAWHCLLASQLLSTGQVVHSGTYLLESMGGRDVQFRLPAECVLRHVEVDGSEVPHLTDLGVRRYGVALPDEQRYVCLRITYLVSGKKFALTGDVAARFPEVDFPVLDAHWTVWLPPGIQPSSMHGKAWPREPRVPTRTDRLLGPLAAPESHCPFDFFSREHWGELAGGARGGRSSAAPAHDFLRTLGSQVLDVPAGATGGVSWRELLGGCVAWGEASPGPSLASVWVDVASLAEEGFSLNDAVTPVDETNPADAAATVLADARMVVVACGENLLLTSVQGFARHVASFEMTDNRVVAVARPGYRLSAEALTGEHGSDAAVVPLAAWITRPEAAGSPWRAAREIAWAGPMHHLWRACEVRVGPGTDCRLAVYRPAALQTLGWAALLATAGALCWLATTRPGLLVAAVPLGAVLALVVPELWVPVAAGLFVGTLLGTLLVLVRRRAPSRARGGIATAGNAHQVPSGVAVGTVLLVGLIAGSATLDGAEEPVPPGGTGPSGPVHQLIVPVDEAMEPVGGYDYLPLPLYDALHQRANAGRGMRYDWLVLSAG